MARRINRRQKPAWRNERKKKSSFPKKGASREGWLKRKPKSSSSQ